MTAKKQITQATFDETVSENIEEFELSREEAVKDAINQFTSQGNEMFIGVGDIDWIQLSGNSNYLHRRGSIEHLCKLS